MSLYASRAGRKGVLMAKARKVVKKKEKLSKEEILYRSAVSLMEAVDCVDRFEAEVSSLKDAAEMFGKLDGYKDSMERRQKCIEDAQAAQDKGTVETFNEAVLKLGKAVTKSDFADAAEDFRRAGKSGYKKEECTKNIKVCQKGIRRLETRAAYKRRGITLCIVALLLVLLIKSPFYPMAKGIYYQSKGKYRVAIDCYIQSGGILVGNGNIKKCYYHIAEKHLKEGSYKKALGNYKKAGDKYDAEKKAFEIEKKFISGSDSGNIVRYGKGKWIILDKTDDQVLLFGKETGRRKKFDKERKNIWQDSSLRRWLNKEYIKKFSKEERAAMADQTQAGTEGSKDKELLFILDREQYNRYLDKIPTAKEKYWLKDAGGVIGNVQYVKEDASVSETLPDSGDVAVRCAFWVKVR